MSSSQKDLFSSQDNVLRTRQCRSNRYDWINARNGRLRYMEDIEGIVDQHLGDRRLSQEEEGTLVSKRSTKVKKSKRLREYKDFISYVMSQLPPKRRRAVENKYEMLQNGEGKNNFLIFFFVSSVIIVY